MKEILHGVRVLELSRVLAGPLCGMHLADFGAEVIKIEHPQGGDETRLWGPPFDSQTGLSAYFQSVNRGKKSVAADFAKDNGAVRKLAAKCDVVIENFPPDSLKKYKLDFESVRAENSAVIYCSITGYGQSGEWKNRRGYDFIMQGESGLMALGGEASGAPCKTGVAICDIFAGLHSAQAIFAALLRREKNGEGAHIDISLFDCAIAALVNVGQATLMTGESAKRFGNDHPHIVPYGSFFAKDEMFNLAAGNDRQFASLCEVLQKPEWAKTFYGNPNRVQNREKLIAMLNAEFRKKTADEWIAACRKRGVPAGKVLNPAEALQLPHAKSRELLQTSAAGETLMQTPIRFCGEQKPRSSSPPKLGAHTDKTLQTIAGLSPDEIRNLRAQNKIGAADNSDHKTEDSS